MTHSELEYVHFHLLLTSNPLYFGGITNWHGGCSIRLWDCFAVRKTWNQQREDWPLGAAGRSNRKKTKYIPGVVRVNQQGVPRHSASVTWDWLQPPRDPVKDYDKETFLFSSDQGNSSDKRRENTTYPSTCKIIVTFKPCFIVYFSQCLLSNHK